MMHQRRRNQPPVAPAHLAQRVRRQERRAYLLPGVAVAFLVLGIAHAFIVVARFGLGVVGAVTVIRQVWAPGAGAGFRSLVRQ